MKQTKYDVFISYSTKDQKVAEGICAYLEQKKIRCFVAYRDIPQGKVWARAIVEALEVSSMMVVIFSKNFNVSEQVDREIELAAEDRKPILTFRLSDDDFQGAKKYYLKNLNWIDAFPNPDACFGKLSEGVLRLLGRPVEGGSDDKEPVYEASPKFKPKEDHADKVQPRQRPVSAPAPKPPKRWKTFFKNNRKWFFLGLAIVAVVLLAVVLWPRHDTTEIVENVPIEGVEPIQEAELQPQAQILKLVPSGYTDLGLPSGTIWKNSNAEGLYTYDEAVSQFGNRLPTKEQWQELKAKCRWTWNGNGYKVTGPNGNSIVLPAKGSIDCEGGDYGMGFVGYYWSSTPKDSECAWDFIFDSGNVNLGHEDNYDYAFRCFGQSVRLVEE